MANYQLYCLYCGADISFDTSKSTTTCPNCGLIYIHIKLGNVLRIEGQVVLPSDSNLIPIRLQYELDLGGDPKEQIELMFTHGSTPVYLKVFEDKKALLSYLESDKFNSILTESKTAKVTIRIKGM